MSRVCDFGLGGQFPDSSTNFEQKLRTHGAFFNPTDRLRCELEALTLWHRNGPLLCSPTPLLLKWASSWRIDMMPSGVLHRSSELN